MKIVLFASLFAVIERGGADLDRYYQLNTNAVDKTYDVPLSKDYKEVFSAKYSSAMSARLLNRVAENYGHLSYGDGKKDAIGPCEALPDLKDCFRRMEWELAGVAESVAAKLVEKYEKFLDRYGRLALTVIEAYERLDAPGDAAVAVVVRQQPFAHVTFAAAGQAIVCVLEFLNNANADVDRVFRKYDLYADRSPAKKAMTAKELKRAIAISLTTTDGEHWAGVPRSFATGSGRSNVKRFEEACDRLREFEKTIVRDGELFCEEPERARLNEGSLKWSVIREWEEFDKEFYNGVTLSDHKALIDDQGISLNDIYGHFSTMPTSWKEMMMANQLVPFVLNNFFSKLTLHVHTLALKVSKKFSLLPANTDQEYIKKTFLVFESLVNMFRISLTFLYRIMKLNENVIQNLNKLCDCYGDPMDIIAKFKNKLIIYNDIKNRFKLYNSMSDVEVNYIAHQNINVELVRDDFEVMNVKLIELTDEIKSKLGI